MNSFTRSKKLALAGLASGLLLAAAFGVYLMRGDAPAQSLQTVTSSRGTVENAVSAVGILQPSRFVDVGAQVSGQLSSLKVTAGDVVEKNQLLAEIDPRVQTGKVAAAKATLDNLKAQLTVKTAQLSLQSKVHARNLALLEQGSVARNDADVSEAALATARGDVAALKAQIEQSEAVLATARTNLEYTRITAPMAGTVIAIKASEGQTLNANQQTPIIVRIADMDTMTVWTQVSEADVLRLFSGQEVYFTVLGQPDKRWGGRLQQVLPTPEIINNVTFFNALFDVPNPGRELRVQMTAQVFVVLEKAEDAVLVPVSALKQPGGGKTGVVQQDGVSGVKGRKWFLQVLRLDGIVEDREVVVGVMSPVHAEIVAGLSEGEIIVVGVEQTRKQAGQGGLGGGSRRAL